MDLFAVYSHLIDSGLYLSNYPISYIIEYQIEHYIKGKSLGDRMERMCSTGSITPDQWVKQVVGDPVSSTSLLQASDKAL